MSTNSVNLASTKKITISECEIENANRTKGDQMLTERYKSSFEDRTTNEIFILMIHYKLQIIKYTLWIIIVKFSIRMD